MKYYLVGIKGSGMSALAKLLKSMGNTVMGCDYLKHFYTEDDMADIIINDMDIEYLNEDYTFIIGNAFLENPLTEYIINNGYKYYTYPEFIDKLAKEYTLVCISGTHGKTTTAKLASMMIENSTYLIGDGTSRAKGNVFVLEACEYKDTFLNYHPDISVVLNVDYDHPDYFKTKKDYDSSFLRFMEQSKLVVCNGDSFYVNKENVITYGIDDKNDIVFDISYLDDGMIINILDNNIKIPMLSKCHAYDFVGAYIVAKLLDMDDEKIANAVKNFKMPKRRMEKIDYLNYSIYLDYAHHPKEISCVYDFIKMTIKNKKIVCVFQPHTISRIKCFLSDFKKSLDLFDEVYLLPIFSSVREYSDLSLEKELYSKLEYTQINSLAELQFSVDKVYLFLGAGDIDVLLKNKLARNVSKTITKTYEND